MDRKQLSTIPLQHFCLLLSARKKRSMNTEVGGVLSPALKQNNHHSAAQHVLHTFKLKQMRMIFSLVSVCVCVCVGARAQKDTHAQA